MSVYGHFTYILYIIQHPLIYICKFSNNFTESLLITFWTSVSAFNLQRYTHNMTHKPKENWKRENTSKFIIEICFDYVLNTQYIHRFDSLFIGWGGK